MLALETLNDREFLTDEWLPNPADVMVVCSRLINFNLVTDQDNDKNSGSGEDRADSGNIPA